MKYIAYVLKAKKDDKGAQVQVEGKPQYETLTTFEQGSLRAANWMSLDYLVMRAPAEVIKETPVFVVIKAFDKNGEDHGVVWQAKIDRAEPKAPAKPEPKAQAETKPEVNTEPEAQPEAQPNKPKGKK